MFCAASVSTCSPKLSNFRISEHDGQGTVAPCNIMRTIIVTGSAGLIGSETVRRFARDGARVLGIDNDMRAEFFGAEASTKKTRDG